MFTKLEYIKIFSFILLFVYIITIVNTSSRSLEIKDKLKNLIKNKSLMINTFIIFIFSIATLNNNYFIKNTNISKKIYESTKHAIIAFLIAIFAHLELKTAAFWLIWLATYYLI